MDMKMRSKSGKRGQVFAIDVLFSILPVMMILGASLQYAYLGEEQMKILSADSQRQGAMQALSEHVMAEYRSSPDGQPYVTAEPDYACGGLKDAIGNAPGMPQGYEYHVRVEMPSSSEEHICLDDELWSHGGTQLLDAYYVGMESSTRLPGASGIRFMLEYDEEGRPIPGQIAGVSFTVWDADPADYAKT